MFTGIIEEIGRMRSVTQRGQAMVITIHAKRILEDIHLGDSIAVNGVCLTVISFDMSSFTVDVMPETFRQTNLRNLKIGNSINLERAMSAQGRFGGHIVQGHVDCAGLVRSKKMEENAIIYTIEPNDPNIFKYIIPRGSITIDGISLTVVKVTDSDFSVSIIPHTLSQTVMGEKYAGDTVNIECDLLGKYMERLLTFKDVTKEDKQHRKASTLTEAFLTGNGF